MDGCESPLNHFVDLPIDSFDRELQWKRTDILQKSTRGCISNDQSTILCAVDTGYASINVTNGQTLWTMDLNGEAPTTTISLPIVNYAGFSIIANSSRCTLLSPDGAIGGTFDYTPKLIPPLAGPVITEDGQIIVADAKSVRLAHRQRGNDRIDLFEFSLLASKIRVFHWAFKHCLQVLCVDHDR